MNPARSKTCAQCQKTMEVAFRIRLGTAKDWVFVCTECCRKSQTLPGYQYGGTWKSVKKQDR